MNKWEQYRVQDTQTVQNSNLDTTNVKTRINKWEQYRVKNDTQKVQNNPIASGLKAVASGVVGAIPDTASLLYNLPVMGINIFRDKPFPLIPSATEAIDQKIDNLTKGYTKTSQDQKSINEGLKFASGFLTGGGIAKTGNKLLSKIGNWTGTTNPLQVAGAGAAGVTGSYLADNNASTGETLGGAIASNLLVSNANKAKLVANQLKKGIDVGRLKMTGLDKLTNLEAAKAAQELNIPVPNLAFTKQNKLLRFADNLSSKIPFSTSKIEKKSLIDQGILKNLNEVYDSILDPANFAKADETIATLYSNANKLVENKTLSNIQTPSIFKKQINILNNELVKSPETIKIINTLKKSEAVLNKQKTPSVESFIKAKQNLNEMIYGDLAIKTSTGRSALKAVRESLITDLENYGKTNPDWYDYYIKADKLYGKSRERQKFESILQTNSTNINTGEVTYNNLSKILNNKEKINKLVTNQLIDFNTIEKLEKLRKVTAMLAQKDVARHINDSSIFDTASVLTGVVGATTGNVLNTIMSTVGSGLIAKLFTNRKLLDKAIEFAENNNRVNAINFNRELKKSTGYTASTLIKVIQPNNVTRNINVLQKNQQAEQKKDTTTKYYNAEDFAKDYNSPAGQKIRRVINANFLNPTGE